MVNFVLVKVLGGKLTKIIPSMRERTWKLKKGERNELMKRLKTKPKIRSFMPSI